MRTKKKSVKDCRANNKRKMAVLLGRKNLHIDQLYIRGVITEKSLISHKGKTLKEAFRRFDRLLREKFLLKYPGLK